MEKITITKILFAIILFPLILMYWIGFGIISFQATINSRRRELEEANKKD